MSSGRVEQEPGSAEQEPGSAKRHPVTAWLLRSAIDVTPLQFEHFRRIFLGNAVATIGLQLTAVAVPVQVYALHRSTWEVGLVGAVGLVPLIVFGLWGGAIADAMDRRRLLLVSSVVLWLCTVGLLLEALTGPGTLGVLLVLTAVQSGAYAVASSVRGAIIPRVLPTRNVPAGNTLEFTAMTLGGVIGPLIAGVVLARWSYAAAYGIDAALFSFALYAALRLPVLEPIGEKVAADWRAVTDGLAYIATQPVLALSFAVDIAAMVLAMPKALFPAAALTTFGGGSAAGWLFAAIPIGSVIAGLSSGWIGRIHRQGVALVLAVVGWGLAVAASGLAGSLWLAVTLLALAGAADLVSGVFRQTILQTYTPDAMRGRLQGVFMVVVAGGPRLGDLRAGGMASLVGVTASWTAGGVACAVLVLLAFLSPSLRRYDSRDTLTEH